MSATEVSLEGVPAKILRGVVVPVLLGILLLFAIRIPPLEARVDAIQRAQDKQDDVLGEMRKDQLEGLKAQYTSTGRTEAAEDIGRKLDALAAKKAVEEATSKEDKK